jgi:hypothetical protein
LCIVIASIERVFGVRIAVIAVGGHRDILPLRVISLKTMTGPV